MRREEWAFQNFRIGDKYFFFKVGMFGDVAAGDNWDCQKVVDVRATQVELKLDFLECYVDNTWHLVGPSVEGVPNYAQANGDFEAFLSRHKKLNTPLHGIIPPTHRTESCLGWGVDTQLWIVCIKEERRVYLIKRYLISLSPQ